MKLLLIASLVALPVLAPATAFAEGTVAPAAVTASWRATHTVAAQNFDRWAQQDPEAQAVVAFATAHPGRTKQLLAWAVLNPTGQLSDFNATHGDLAADLAKTPNGAAHLMDWARHNTAAAKVLAESPNGFGAAVAQK